MTLYKAKTKQKKPGWAKTTMLDRVICTNENGQESAACDDGKVINNKKIIKIEEKIIKKITRAFR